MGCKSMGKIKMEKKIIKKGNCTVEVEGDLRDPDRPKFKIRTKGDCSHVNLGDEINGKK